MIEWWKRRRLRKVARHVLHDSRRLRNMREDIAERSIVAAILDAESTLREAQRGGDLKDMEAAIDRLGAAMEHLAPPKAGSRMRENIEILVVAIVVAMAFRTYFIQPFKIPTGSMQPTLYGIAVEPQLGKRWYDNIPFNLVPLALFGERYQEIRAKADGLVESRYYETEETVRFIIGGLPHDIPRGMSPLIQPGLTRVTNGQIIASGRVRMGDHIFVNKMRYNFSRPQRGDIFVFNTDGIDYDRVRPHSFYIKRMAGLPGEHLELEPPYMVADGKRITEPYPFERLLHAKEQGYHGYQLPYIDRSFRVALGLPGQTLQLTDTQYLPLGDNTMSSLDGRYFGAVERKNIVGPAFMVYWPFGKRWGFTDVRPGESWIDKLRHRTAQAK